MSWDEKKRNLLSLLLTEYFKMSFANASKLLRGIHITPCGELKSSTVAGQRQQTTRVDFRFRLLTIEAAFFIQSDAHPISNLCLFMSSMCLWPPRSYLADAHAMSAKESSDSERFRFFPLPRNQERSCSQNIRSLSYHKSPRQPSVIYVVAYWTVPLLHCPPLPCLQLL